MLKKSLISGFIVLTLLAYSGFAYADTAQANTAQANKTQADSAIKRLHVGSILPPVELKTQHGKTVKISNDVKTLLFAVEKAPSALINSFILKQEVDYLTKNKAYFVADISGMPSMITKMFAIPKMKKRPYDILLAKGETQVSFIPRKKNFVTVLKIAKRKITAIEFVNNVDQLKSF